MKVVRKDATADAYRWDNQPQDELPRWLVTSIDRISNFTGRLHLNDDAGYAETGEWLVHEGGHISIYTNEEFNNLFQVAPDGS